MAHEKHIVDRLSTRLPSLLPEYIRDEAPVFELFLQSYFEYLESEIIVLTSKGELTGIRYEDGTSETASSVLIEEGTETSAPDILTSKLIQEGDIEPFSVGEYIYGNKSGSVAKIKVINGLTLIVDTISGTGFSETETITGRDGNQNGVVKTYKENQVVANNRLLDYSDIDQTLETFLQYFQKDFVPSLDLKETQNARLTIKNIGTLYKQKGTADSVKFLMRLLYGEDAEITYPIDETVFASESGYGEDRRLAISMNLSQAVPSATDRIRQYDINDASIVTAEAVVEQVSPIDLANNEYSLSISKDHRGTFEFNKEAKVLDRDGVTEYIGTVKGIVSTVDPTNGSIYFSLEDSTGSILDESGNGLLHEETSIGSMYSPQDFINFTGSKTDTDANRALGNVTGLTRGPVEKIYIETTGQTYSGGDIVVFDDEGTGGGGAEGIIGAVGDEIILEDAHADEQYEITAVANQTVFGGVIQNGTRFDNVLDDHGKPISINRFHGALEVHIDGIVQSQSTYSIEPQKITFTTNPNLSGGERVEIFTDKSRLLYEDGTEMLINAYQNTDGGSIVSTDQRVRRVEITSGGAGYETLPQAFPGGYLYFEDTTGFQKGETITGSTSNATGTILRLEPKNNRLVIKRFSTDTGIFQAGENIVGGNSSTTKVCSSAKVSDGTGAKFFAWSSRIGGIEKVTLLDQGSKFDSDAVLDEATSFHNMLITTPSGTLNKGITITGVISGATATVQNYDTIRQILKYKNLKGMFINDEKVTYESSDSFLILKNDPYTARGKVAGEGLINDGFLSDKGYLSSKVANIQDSKFYQSHSYVIKVGESINKYRSIVKDLVHPSGHLFFGEVALKSQLLGSSLDGVKEIPFDVNEQNKMGIISTEFVPTIVIQAYPTDNMLFEESTRDKSVRVLTEDGHLLENEDSRDNTAHLSKETLMLFHTTSAEVAGQDMITQYVEASGTNISTDKHKGAGHLNILNRKEFITSALDTKIDNDPSTVSSIRRPTITEFNTFIQKSPRRDGAVTVLNLDTADHDYYVNNSDVPLTSEYGNVAVRPADSGKVFQFWHPSEEILILEDGTKILNEEPLNYVRFDPFDRDLYGEKILMEDGSGSFLLEDETVPETREYFVTERSIELDNSYMYMEDNSRIVFEDGIPVVDEESGEEVHTFIPIGPTLKTLNKIAFQNCYKISHYILDETSSANEEDKILLEDGISGLLSEESEKDGLTIKQMSDMTGLLYVEEIDKKQRRRTNIAFSSYVNSSNITNSALALL